MESDDYSGDPWGRMAGLGNFCVGSSAGYDCRGDSHRNGSAGVLLLGEEVWIQKQA
ncbi:hypothetical protein D3C86_2029410 [compost metagenome]